MEVLADPEAALLEQRQQALARRARVRRRLEHDQLAFLEASRDVLDGAHHERQVGLALRRERRRQRDEDRLGLLQRVVVGGDLDRPRLDVTPQVVRVDVPDVALASPDGVDLLGIRLDEHDAVACLGEDLGEREADIAGSDDPDVSLHRGDSTEAALLPLGLSG